MPRAVGQFRELVESCTKDAPLQEALKKALNFTAKGWEAARAHALRAVSTDNRMRVWVSDDSHEAGALFRCHWAAWTWTRPWVRPAPRRQGIHQGRV